MSPNFAGCQRAKKFVRLAEQDVLGAVFGTRGCFGCSSGVTDEMVMEYIETQDTTSDGNFKVAGGGAESA